MSSSRTTRSDVTFSSGGVLCAGWLYRPMSAVDSGPTACVVMAHGFSLTRYDGLAAYAEALAATGAAVLVYDHRFLGDSAGTPRQKVSIGEQLRDRRAAIAYARGLDEIDPSRIVLWGYSLGGQSVVLAAASDPQIAGAILMFPMLDGRARLTAGLRDDPRNAAWTFGRTLAAAVVPSLQIPVTAPHGGRAVMTLPGEADGFGIAVEDSSPWRNSVLARTMPRVALSRPVTEAHRVTCPALVQIGDIDVTAPQRAIERFADRAPNSTLMRYDLDHFDPFALPHQGQLANDQARWLRGLV